MELEEILAPEGQSTTTEPVAEPRVGVQAEPQVNTQEPVAEPQVEVPSWIESFNKDLGTEYKTAEDIKGLIESTKNSIDPNTYQEERTALEGQIEELRKAKESLIEQADPLKYFKDKETYNDYHIRDKAVEMGKDPDVVSIMNRVDDSKFNNLELATLNMKYTNNGLSDNEAASLVLDQLGIEITGTTDKEISEQIDEAYKELTPLQTAKLKKFASDARLSIQEVRKIEIPEIVDYEKQIETKNADRQKRIDSLKEGWSKQKDSIMSALDKIPLTKDNNGKEEVVFEFDIDSKAKAAAYNDIESWFTINNIEPTEENVNLAINEWKQSYGMQNWRNIAMKYADSVNSNLTERHIQETENRQPVNTNTNQEYQANDLAKLQEEQLRAGGIFK